MAVRRIVHSLGYRYRLHVRELPGNPDLVFPRLRKIILVHGCFWHRHSCTNGIRTPKSRVRFWRTKLEANASRDRRVVAMLRKDKWRVLVLWECQLKDRDRIAKRLAAFLGRG
jgi:DNA mismatch endonuclease (patch repair protein)